MVVIIVTKPTGTTVPSKAQNDLVRMCVWVWSQSDEVQQGRKLTSGWMVQDGRVNIEM